jgi:hypothetical protein
MPRKVFDTTVQIDTTLMTYIVCGSMPSTQRNGSDMA